MLLDGFYRRFVCPRFGHRWEPYETYHGEWWDVCERCHTVSRHKRGDHRHGEVNGDETTAH